VVGRCWEPWAASKAEEEKRNGKSEEEVREKRRGLELAPVLSFGVLAVDWSGVVASKPAHIWKAFPPVESRAAREGPTRVVNVLRSP